MAEDSGETLHRSLNAVDAYRKRIMIAFVFLAVLLLVVFFYGTHTAGRDTVSSVLAHFFMLIIWVTGLTVLVMIQISAMTKRILRAIELASKK